eukprot:817462-Pleurochrysis_carterae.AAC.2
MEQLPTLEKRSLCKILASCAWIVPTNAVWSALGAHRRRCSRSTSSFTATSAPSYSSQCAHAQP